MKKRIAALFSALVIVSLLFVSCGDAAKKAPAGGKLRIIGTLFPHYDFARAVAGDKADVTMLLPPGAESHSFEPTPQDIIKMKESGVFIYTGGESDVWVDDILASMDMSKVKVIKLMDAVDTVEEEVVGSMEEEHGHDHEADEFDEAAIQDRPMRDFAGSWVSMVPLIKDGSLDAYMEHSAEEAEVPVADYKANVLQKVASDYDTVAIAGSTVTAGGVTADYNYKGHQIVENEHGKTVWYKYESVAAVGGQLRYLMFTDHQIASGAEKEEVPHMHMKYGGESFEALLAEDAPTPFYFDSAHSNVEIGQFMAGEHEEEEEGEYDEHVWTSPRNAIQIVAKLAEVFGEADPEHKDAYKTNADAYIAQLEELDGKMKALVDGAARKTIVFGDRFPFRYFADAYGLTYDAAFVGCSTETEASPRTVKLLIDTVKAEKIPVVFHIELSTAKIAETIAEATGAKVLLLHSCHNITKNDFNAGKTYVDLMNANLGNLQTALY